jgi:hypothetical protein
MQQIPRPPLLTQARRREWSEGVTFREFRQLAQRCGWTPESVAAALAARGANGWGGPRESPHYERSGTYLHRVLRRGHAADDDQVIPYRCVIALYVEATAPPLLPPDVRRCRCSCGSPVYGTHAYATPGCRVRAWRQRRLVAVPDGQKGSETTQRNRGDRRYTFGDLDPEANPPPTVTRRPSESLLVPPDAEG